MKIHYIRPSGYISNMSPPSICIIILTRTNIENTCFFFILHIFMEKFQIFEFQIIEWFHFWILSRMDNNICSEISPIILYTEFLPLKYFQSEFFQITTMIWFFHVESSIKNFFLKYFYLPACKSSALFRIMIITFIIPTRKQGLK